MFLPLLLACGPPLEVPPLKLAELPERGPLLSLEMSPVSDGGSVRFTVRGVAPLENAYVVWSVLGPGPGPCPQQLVGACLDLLGPSDLLGPGPADASGVATLEVTPVGLGSATTLWGQAVVFRLDGTLGETPVIARPIFDSAEIWTGDAVVTDEASLAALSGIAAIEGELRIEGTSLVELSLPDLVQVGGDLVVWRNDALASMRLPRLGWVGGALSLYDNGALGSLTGLLSLRSVGGELSINRMEALPHLRGLDNLETVGGHLYLFHDTALATLDGLGALQRVGGAAVLWELYALQQARLPSLQEVGGRLDLFDADRLEAVSMPALSQLGGYEIHHCDQLQHAGDFPQLRAARDLTLRYNERLSDLSGLSGLETLGPSGSGVALAVQACPALTSLSALSGLGTITGEVALVNNPALSHCEVEAWLAEVAVAGGVSCSGNFDDGCAAVCLP